MSQEGGQQALRKIIEGNRCERAPKGRKKEPATGLYKVDTSNILFICGGPLTPWNDRASRMARKVWGSELISRGGRTKEVFRAYREIQPEDLLK